MLNSSAQDLSCTIQWLIYFNATDAAISYQLTAQLNFKARGHGLSISTSNQCRIAVKLQLQLQ